MCVLGGVRTQGSPSYWGIVGIGVSVEKSGKSDQGGKGRLRPDYEHYNARLRNMGLILSW